MHPKINKLSFLDVTVTFAYSSHKMIPLVGIKEIKKGINKAFDSISKVVL